MNSQAGDSVSKRKMAAVLVATGLLAVITYATTAGAFVAYARAFFSDTGSHWGNRWISVLAARGVVNGMEPGRFAPDGEITRAQAAKLLVMALGHEKAARELHGANSRFPDLWGHWSAPFAAAASEIGLFSGYEDGTFRPDSPISRAELAVVTLRAVRISGASPGQPSSQTPVPPAGSAPKVTFTDQELIPVWARDQVTEAAARGLVQGFPDGAFRPSGRAVRVEMAALVSRLLNLRGDLFDLEGVVEDWNPAAGIIKVGPHSYRLVPGAVVRGPGGESDPSSIKGYHWVRGILDRDGGLNFLEAVLLGEVGHLVRVQGSVIDYRPAAGGNQTKSTVLASGAKIFRDGRRSEAAALRPGDRLYLVKDPKHPETVAGVLAEAPAEGQP